MKCKLEDKKQQMTLSDEQQEEMYADTLKTRQDMEWVRERLEKGEVAFNECKKRLRSLEQDQIKLDGKLGLIILAVSGCFTAVLHTVGWIVSHIWK